MSRAEPHPPDDLAEYVVEAIARQDPEQLESIERYARELREYRERVPLDIDDEGGSGTVVKKKVSCGKADCSTCPHGPYRYRVERSGDTLSWEYLGPVAE